MGVVDLEPRVWFNEGLDSRNFIIPGVVAVILALVGAQLTSLTVSREWERGTMEQLISTPVTALEVDDRQAGAVFRDRTVRRGVLPVRRRVLVRACRSAAAWSRWSLTTALFTLVVLGIGYLRLGAHPQPARRQPDRAGADHAADHLAVGLHLPDRSDAARRSRRVTLLVYARYYITILRAVFLKGSTLGDLAVPVLALVLYAVVDHLARRARLPQAAGLADVRPSQRHADEGVPGAPPRPWAMFRLVVPLLIQVIVFGYAATFTVNHVATVVLDLDRSQASRSLISHFVATGRFDIVDVAANADGRSRATSTPAGRSWPS